MSYLASKGSGGGGSTNFSGAETPTGAIDGTNDTFTLANTPSPALSLQLFLNGQLQAPDGEDFTLTGNSIVFVSPPLVGSILTAYYMYA